MQFIDLNAQQALIREKVDQRIKKFLITANTLWDLKFLSLRKSWLIMLE